MNLDPGLNQPALGNGYLTSQQSAVEHRESGILALVLRVNMWQLVALIVKKVEVDDNSIMLIVGIAPSSLSTLHFTLACENGNSRSPY